MKKIIFFIATTLFSFAGKEIHVDLSDQKAYAIENGEVVFDGRISSGRPGRETPVGTFKITQKKKKHVSNLWPRPNGGAKMPYMMRLSGSPIALHLGYVPDRPDSHGCVRLEHGFAQKMYKWADIGTKVTITGDASEYVPSSTYTYTVRKKKRKHRLSKAERERRARKLAKIRREQEIEASFDALGYYDEDIPKGVEVW